MFYTENLIDRLDHLRADESAIEEFWQSTACRVIPIWRNRALVQRQGEAEITSCQVSPAALPQGSRHRTFLGHYAEQYFFAVELDPDKEPDLDRLLSASNHTNQQCQFEDMRVVGPSLAADQGALLIYARAVNVWQNQSPFCSQCGHAAHLQNAGHARLCSNQDCKAQIFPRTDPAVIMLVEDGNNPDRCLLGRSPAWPEGVYSTLAGFVEAGESLEAAVAREVQEETGILVEDIRYATSQPWPFPRSIMLGFRARAKTTELQVNTNELEDARWFTRDEISGFGEWAEQSDRFKLPRRDSIARYLVDSWLNSEN